ncbi:MAG: helix-turn-helix domain-containing protein [Candidatus Dojkabacteria bacterium]|nr:MAG: helix-turn-helix domain-containing protein [Candidatus Dojkabacteria bacterium]
MKLRKKTKIREPKKPAAPISTANMLTAGQVLKSRRKELRLSIDRVSAETKIQKRYIEIIEADDYDQLESTVFISGFIKIYAEYLSLNVDKVLALYRRNSSTKADQAKKAAKEVETQSLKDYLTPQTLVLLLVAATIVGLFSYIGVQFYRFQKEPYLIIASPTELTFETTDEILLIKGQTESGTILTVNEDTVPLDDQDKFEYEYDLQEGNNTIIVKAVRNNNKRSETLKVLEVKYITEEEAAQQAEENPPPEEAPPPATEYKLKVEVVDDEAWIKIVVDDTQQYAQILPPGFSEEFTVKSSFEVISGRPTITNVYVNGEAREMVLDSESGTAKLNCSISGDTLSCQD